MANLIFQFPIYHYKKIALFIWCDQKRGMEHHSKEILALYRQGVAFEVTIFLSS